MRSVGLSPVLELWVGVVGGELGACARLHCNLAQLQTVARSLSVINTLKQPRAVCSDAVRGALVVWQR